MTTNTILHELMNTKTIADFADYIKEQYTMATKSILQEDDAEAMESIVND